LFFVFVFEGGYNSEKESLSNDLHSLMSKNASPLTRIIIFDESLLLFEEQFRKDLILAVYFFKKTKQKKKKLDYQLNVDYCK